MKKINLKNTGKLFLLLFFLGSTNVFSSTKIPTDASSRGNESRFGCSSKATKVSKKPIATYSSRGIAMQAKSKKCFKK
nr:hypothetical protein [uncultured Flavobacterium sp.]